MATILLVDDDPLQASLRKSFLERRFPDVRRVGGMAEALCLVEQPQFANNLGLIISGHQRHSDIGVSDFVAELHTRMPSVPILVLDDNSDQDLDFVQEDVYVLERPVRADQMLDAATQLFSRKRLKIA